MDRYVAYLHGQLEELLTQYGPIGILWFDGEWEEPWTEERARALYRHCRSLQPSVIINNRVGKGREDMAGTTAAGSVRRATTTRRSSGSDATRTTGRGSRASRSASSGRGSPTTL